MEIAKYFASLSIKVADKDVKSVDAFLNNVGKGLKTNAKSTDTLEKAVKKETKTTVDGLVQKEQKTKALNKQITVAAKNQKAWNKEFAYSLKMMTSKPLSKTALKAQQGVYDQLFGAVTPKAMIGATGSNQRAWNTRFRQQIAGMSATSGISRRARQEQLEAAFGTGTRNPRLANMLNQRMSHLGGGKSDTLADMAAYYRNEQKVAALKERVTNQEEAATRRILALRQRELAREERTRQRMAHLEGRRSTGQWMAPPGSGGSSSGGRRSGASYSRANYLHAGGATGAFMRYGVASLPLIGGVYGASALNAANQNMVNANIAAESVLGANAPALLNRLSERSNYMGISYKDTLPQFTKFMASSIPLMGVNSSQATFESFMQFGRTRGADKISMNRALTAVGQMSAKGQVMAEELKGQLGDASGFGEVPQLFAEAYQIKTGGGLTGAKARAALMDAMQKGQVKTADILPLVAKLMDDLSRGGIEKARQSSTAQQARAENAISGRGGLLQTFSEKGGERGFARLWSSFAVSMKESIPLVETLGKAFDKLSQYTSFAMMLPQSFKRAFEGRDSWVADAIGEMNAKIVYDLGVGLGELGIEISKTLGTAVDGWGMILQAFGPAITDFLRRLKDVFLYTFKILNSFLPGGGGMGAATNASRAMMASLNGATPAEVKAIAEGQNITPASQGTQSPWMTPLTTAGQFGYRVATEGSSQIWNALAAPFKGGKLSDGDRASIDYQREMAMSREQFKASQNNQVNISSGAIVINANTSDPQALSDTLMSTLRQEADKMFVTRLDTTMLSFPQGE